MPQIMACHRSVHAVLEALFTDECGRVNMVLVALSTSRESKLLMRFHGVRVLHAGELQRLEIKRVEGKPLELGTSRVNADPCLRD